MPSSADRIAQLEARVSGVFQSLSTFHYAAATLMLASLSEPAKVQQTVLGLAFNLARAERGLLLAADVDDPTLFTVGASRGVEGSGPFDGTRGLLARMRNSRAVLTSRQVARGLADEDALAPWLVDYWAILPLLVEGEVEAFLLVSGGKMTEDDLRFLTAFAAMAAAALNNCSLLQDVLHTERLERELEIASRVQTSLLPPNPQVEGFDVAGAMRPAEEVGGDYYDVLPGPDGGSWIGIGDVSGHGLTPGLVMMMTQSIVSALAMSNPDSRPADVLKVLNRVLVENIQTRLSGDDHMTLTLLRYYGDGQFEYSGAHEDIVVYRRATGKCECISTRGAWVGILDDIEDALETDTLQLEPGDIMVLYTDGIIECRNADGEQLDMRRMCRLIEGAADRSAAALCDHLIKSATDWMFDQDDDLTVLVLKRGLNA